MTSVCPFLCEEETFFTLKFARIASFTCASHMPQAIPSIESTVFVMIVFLLFVLHAVSYHKNVKTARHARNFIEFQRFCLR